MQFVRYSPSVETIAEDEAATFADIAKSFTGEGKLVEQKHGHAMRVSHAKATALLKGELVVAGGLPPELAQGLFATPGRYDVLTRFAQGPGELLSDRTSTHRGMATKVLGVTGARIAQSSEASTQDFVFEDGPAFINKDAKRFALNLKAGVSKAPALPDAVKGAVSNVARVAAGALEAVGVEAPTLDFFGHPSNHPLGEIYFSQVPMRFGDYVAKLGIFPHRAIVDALPSRIDASDDDNAFRTAMSDFFASRAATFDLRVQLCADLDTMPVEDASVEWPEEASPYRTVATLTYPPQSSCSEERRRFFDERLGFRPANSLAAHRPLGQIMRARLAVYARMAAIRQQANGVTPVEPTSIEEVP